MSSFQQLQDQGRIILYDPQCISNISAAWFDADYWQTQQALLGGAPGRGTSAFILTPAGEAVWRHYHRGGLPGRFIRDRYLWTGLNTTRAWQEFHLTNKLLSLGLPVPQPLAAAVKRSGLTYTADLITLRLPNVMPLAECLLSPDYQSLIPALLHQVGACIQRFHAVGLDHVDLNPRNLLVRLQDQQVWLIDFDRCRLGQPDARIAERNLQRLQRGLIKLNALTTHSWMQAIRAGYSDSTTATTDCKKT
ncbi:3-deoxy-D-manno-octulosonic acid kinase [Marinospirillum alkaliphilum]|nr:3-deoxy-D-manno-octulosonic acid kinase [Marinospirillum alkaliphilum]